MLLCPESRVSFQTTSIRPRGPVDTAPNHCQFELDASSLTFTGTLQVVPPSVLRMKCTSSGSPPGGFTEATT